MKHRLIQISLIWFLAIPALSGEEAGFSSYFGTYGLGNYTSESTEYKATFQWGGNSYFQERGLGDSGFGYKLELDSDPILKTRYTSLVKIEKPYYSIGFGPVFGLVNQGWTLIKPGFSGNFTAQYPGIAFFNFGGDLIPLRSALLEEDYSTYSSFYTIGFYVLKDHILCYFTQKRDQYIEIVDSEDSLTGRTSYLFYSEFYEKNSFLKIKTTMGYEIQKQILETSEELQLKSIIFGLNFDFGLSGNSSVFVSIDNILYPITSGDLELSGVPEYLYTFKTGFRWYR